MKEDREAPLLELRALHCTVAVDGQRFEVLRGVSLNLWQGEILGLVGESGSGKTFTMRSIIRMLPRNACMETEMLSFAGIDMQKLTEKSLRTLRGKDISMIFQDPMSSLNPLKRVGQHIMEVLLHHGYSDRRHVRQEALSLLQRVGIPAAATRMRQYPHELSGGMRQRVLIAMALACKPKLLIADEPTTGLDVTIQAQILALIRVLQQKDGMAVVLITHDLGVVASLCHRVAVMYGGLIVEIGPVDEIFDHPLHPYTQALLRSIPAIHRGRERQGRLITIEGQPPSIAHIPPGCPFAPRCTRAGADCTEVLPPLEEYLPDHSARCLRIKAEGL
ncbi:MAG: ABC transporter ATP-binding protein [Spirochaetaceae bacterium]|jgi:oligopeptide/dipeptide ABC transporter ATP-binding protein|nr:ABC transporter ATP-binding protein [Spirochaetaceae bacterium]